MNSLTYNREASTIADGFGVDANKMDSILEGFLGRPVTDVLADISALESLSLQEKTSLIFELGCRWGQSIMLKKLQENDKQLTEALQGSPVH